MCCIKCSDGGNKLYNQLGRSLQDGSDNCFGLKWWEGDDVTELQFDVPGVSFGGFYVGGVDKPGDVFP